MPAFAFLAVDPNGRRIRGIEEAASDAALAHGLEARGLLVVEVAERADAEQRSGFRRGQPNRPEPSRARRIARLRPRRLSRPLLSSICRTGARWRAERRPRRRLHTAR